MRIFALGDSRAFGAPVAAALGRDLDTHEERDFGDGEHKARPMTGIRGEDVYVLHALGGGEPGSSPPNDRLLKLLFFIAACRDSGAARVTAVVPYLAYARKDRQTKRRDPVTTRYVAQLFEAMGTDCVVTLDVHNLPAFQNAFRCRTVHLEARGLFVPHIRALATGRPVTIFSPDGGGVKRAELLRQRYEAVTVEPAGFGFMEKHRSRGVITGSLFAGEVEGCAVFIIDDMISTGGTMCRAAAACRERGARSVFALATHGLFAPGAVAMLADPAIDRILVTDSVPSARRTATSCRDRVEIVSAAPLVAEALRRLHRGGSIAELLGTED